MRKLDESISMPYAIGDFVVRVSASIGLAGYPESGSSVEALLQIADEAMYAAKTDRNGALRRARAA